MAKGGFRKGAGRKPGSANIKTREVADRAALEGITPLEYLIAVMRDDGQDTVRRLDAAKAAAPYMHPRLSALDVRQSVHIRASHEEWLTRLAGKLEDGEKH